MRPYLFFLAILVVMMALLEETNGAPSHHKKHQKCTEKVYTALKSLCSYRGESEFLRNSASECCHLNCDLSEMMTTCMVAPSFEDDLLPKII